MVSVRYPLQQRCSEAVAPPQDQGGCKPCSYRLLASHMHQEDCSPRPMACLRDIRKPSQRLCNSGTSPCSLTLCQDGWGLPLNPTRRSAFACYGRQNFTVSPSRSCSSLTVAVCEWQGRNRETLFPATGAVGASLPTLTRSREKLCGMFWSSPALFTLTRFISRRACSALCQLERIDRQPSDSLSRETM